MQSIVKGKAEYRVLENFYFVGMVGFHRGICGSLDAMLCYWFAAGLIKEELVEKGREEIAENRERRKAEHRVLENFYYVFFVL